MGMGYMASYVDEVSEACVKRHCKNEYLKFYKVIEEEGLDIDTVARETEYGHASDFGKKVRSAYEDLCKAFKHNTGLSLCLCFHDKADYGDRYDDVDGPFWHVDGVWQMTEAGKKLARSIKRGFYVTYG